MAPKAKSVKCTNCKKGADVYCVDCTRELCIFCTTLLHHPDTKLEWHSLEDIVKEDARPEVKIISPILLELILVSGAVFFFSGTGISPDYFSGESYCPGVGRVRYWIARFDANVFFFLKNEFAQYCDCEDSYWRFFMDTWIRSVLTNTDSWILLLASFLKALMVEEFLRIIVTPVVAYLYAILAYFVRSVEFWVHNIFYEHFESQSHPVTKVLDKVSRVVQSLRVADKLGLDAKLAPPTYRRKRQATDVAEYVLYMWRRRFRLMEFYRAQAHAVCNLLLKFSLLAAFILRIVCMIFGSTCGVVYLGYRNPSEPWQGLLLDRSPRLCGQSGGSGQHSPPARLHVRDRLGCRKGRLQHGTPSAATAFAGDRLLFGSLHVGEVHQEATKRFRRHVEEQILQGDLGRHEPRQSLWRSRLQRLEIL